MMRNKKELKSFLLNATRLIVLALCFVTVFAVAMTSDFVDFDSTSNVTKVADAADYVTDKGGATPIALNITPSTIGFPGTAESTWSYKLTSFNLDATNNTGNVSVSKPQSTGVDIDLSASGNSYVAKADGRATKYIRSTTRVNFDFGDFVKKLLDSGNFTVKVSLDVTCSKDGGGSDVTSGMIALASTGKASEYDTDTWGAVSGASTVTLSSSSRYVTYFATSTAENQTIFTSAIETSVTFNSMTVTISLNGNSDGGKPIASNKYSGLENSYVQGSSGSKYLPYVENASDYGIYFDSIKNYIKTDKVTNGSGTMASYTNKTLGTFNGVGYYKFAQTEYVDMYNKTGQSIEDAIAEYGSNAQNYIGVGDKVLSVSGSSYSWSAASGEQYANITGIKSVQVGDTVFDICSSSTAVATQTKAITVTDTDEKSVSVGYATVTRTNRARVVVSVYFTTNCDLTIVVTDFGGLSETSTLKVSGIDTSIKNEGTPMASDDYIGATSPKEWIHSQQYENATDYVLEEDTSAADYSPRLWFYTVDRADTLDALNAITAKSFANAQALLDTGLLPLGVEEGFKLEYDFSVGKAKSRGVDVYDASGVIGSDGKVSSDTSSVQGRGYYRFTIYMIDLAGNISTTTSTYYVKVDYDTPTYNAGLSYVNSDNQKVTILPADNGTWAKGDATISIVLGTVGFSGLTIEFEDSSYTHTLTLTDNLGALATYHTTKTGETSNVSGNTHNVTINTDAGDRNAVVTYNPSTKTVTITVINHTSGVEWITSITTFGGQFANSDVQSEYPGSIKSANDGSWKGGIKVLIDTIAPVAPEFVSSEDTPFSKDFYSDYENLPAVSERTWYLGMYDKYSASIAFDDTFLESSYADNVKVYYGINLIKNVEELIALGNKKIEENYASITESNKGDYFTRFNVIKGGNLAGGDTVLENGAMNIITGAGMRIIYTWAVDQAGNVSELKTYYILADNTTYTLSTKVGTNSVKDSLASILAQNADGATSTTFNRGEVATLVTTLGDDFVPFALSIKANDVTSNLLENYNPAHAWTLVNSAYDGLVNYDNSSAVAFTLDNVNNLGTLDTNKRVELEFAYRKVVSYTVTSTQVAYNSQKATVEMTFTDTASQSAFAYTWYNASGALLDDAPVQRGTYQVEIYIPKDNVNYVTDDFAMDNDGNQTFTKRNIEIVKGKIVVSAVASTSVYGEDRTNILTYTISGIANDADVLASEGLTSTLLTLELNVAGYNPTKFYNVGYYDIVAPNLTDVDNYSVTFESARHNVTQRSINVYTQSAQKVYGDSDPTFYFGIKASDLQFNSAMSASDVLAELFDASYGSASISGEYYVYDAGNRISRQSGENVGDSYTFVSDASQFDVNNNYRIIVQNTGSFAILQRNVQIDVTGQFTVIKNGSTIDVSTIVPSYKLDASDMFLADEIAPIVSLSVATTGTGITGFDTSKYQAGTAYAIVLADNTNANISVTLKDGENNYIVYVAVPGTVIVKAKGEFSFVFGTNWDGSNVVFSSDLFTAEIDEDDPIDFDGIVWSANIGTTGYVGVGSYVLSFDDAHATKDGAQITCNLIIENAIVNITPATVVVRPTYSATSKTYGDAESAFGIGFEIATINGTEIATDGTYAGIDYADVLATISGSYARAKYADNGNFVAFGSRYDGVLSATSGDRYGIAVNVDFASSSVNFTVEAGSDDVTLTIAPKAIDIYTSKLVGINKYWNGNTNVNYGTTSMYDISADLVLASDDVALFASDMAYTGAGSKDSNTNVGIVFKQFVLTGGDSANYTLRYVVRDGNKEATTVSGTSAGDETYLVEGVEVEIYLLKDGENEPIKILVAQIGIKKSDISIVKEYDGTNVLNIGDVTIATSNILGTDGETIIASTASLVGATKTLGSATSSFASSKAGDGYLISRIVLVFSFEGDNMAGKVYDFNEDDVTITVNYDTITVEVVNLRATIAKKELGASSFASLEAVNRDYNGGTEVDVKHTFADGALVTGDSQDSVKVVLKGEVTDKNVGTKTVTFKSATVSNDNYEVDVNDLNNKYTNVQVVISKARLVPNVNFVDKVYDNSTDVTVLAKDSEHDFTTVTYSTNLDEELKHIKMGGSVTYVLSDEGKANANVTCDADGNELAHNVMVSGLKVSVEAGYDVNLDNYRIYGAIYNNGYQEINDVKADVPDYEIQGAVKVSKKSIKLITNDFQISDKVYDGTKNATITIEVPTDGGGREGVLTEHKDLLQITAQGTFDSAKVGTNIKVSIPSNGIVLDLKDGVDGINNTIKNNYYLDKSAGAYASNITGTIIARPVTVSVDLGEMTYTGSADIRKENITYTFNGILANEVKNYNVKTGGGAYFIDKNVAYDVDSKQVLTKDGNVYNPTLIQNKGYDINYVLVYRTDDEDTARRADLVAYDDASGNIKYYPSVDQDLTGATGFYYALNTASKYVLATNATSEHTDYIVGRYKVDGNDVYLLTDAFVGTYQTLAEPVTYLHGTGKILQRGATITSNSIEKVEGTSAFTKVYDGTTKFNGVYGTDYVYTTAGISNVIKGDEVNIASVTAEFDSANTTAMYVVFTASDITGKDAYNYTISVKEGAGVTAYTARLSGQIVPRAIDAELKDGEMIYGTMTGNVGGQIVYTLGENRSETDVASNLLTWVESDKVFYVNFKQFLVEAGFIASLDDAIDTEDTFIKQLIANTYNLEDGNYVKAEDGTLGTYFRLGGETRNQISSLPTPRVTFASSKPSVGQTSTKYVLSGGKANNFKFAFKYSGNGADGSSRVVVVKRDLYVHTAGINVTKVYAGNEQRVDVNYTGGVDVVATLFISGGVNYAPTVVLGIYNVTDKTITAVDKYAKISADLKDDEYYVYYLEMPAGMTSYDDFAPLANYNVIVANKDTVKAVQIEDGKYEFVNDFGTESKKASTATIVLPTISGITVASGADATFDYTYDKATKQGENKVYNVVSGVNADDIVTYFTMVDGNKVLKEARDAGTHTGKVNVKRFVKVDQNDTNGYYVEWESEDEVTIVINKIAPQLKANDAATYYNGSVQEYPLNNNIKLHEGVNGLLSNDYTVSYQLYKNGSWTSVDASEVKNAGNYRATIALTQAFGEHNPNFRAVTVTVDAKGNETTNAVSVTVAFTIKKIDVKVTIDTTGYESSTETTETATLTTLTALYDENKDYSAIGYTVAMGNGWSGDSATAIGKSDTQLVFNRKVDAGSKVVTGSGKYSFSIGIVGDKASNYNLIGNAGVLQLTENKFNVSGGAIDIDGGGIVANQLVVREIVTDNVLASDVSYVAVIEQYMPVITKEANLKYDATVAAIVKMDLYCDGQVVVLDGETTSISIAIPSSVDSSLKGIALYTVTRDGGLKKLTDYTVNNGNIEYTTDYVSALVFVDINAPALETWKIAVIVSVVILVVLIVVATVVGVVVRKKKLPKLI